MQKTRIRKLLSPLANLVPTHKLHALAVIHGTDKLSHGYIDHYAKYFAPIRRNHLNILEIGVGGYQDPKAGANSLRMWQAYFPNSMIYSMDIWDKSYHENRHIKIFQGSQNDREFLERVVAQIGRLDIVIDDGSHISEHVRTSFAVLFPRLATSGIYVIEDMHTSYLPEFGGNSENLTDARTSMALIKDLLDSVNDQYIPNRASNSLDGQVEAVHVHPKIAFIYKGGEAKKFDGIVDH